MTWSPSSRISVLVVAAVLVASLAVPAAAVSIASEDVPEPAAADEEVTATFEITELYQDPSFESWNLTGSTELESVTWTVAFVNPSGETVATRNYDGQSFETPPVSSNTDVDDDGDAETITDMVVTVQGTVPEPTNFTYPDEETYRVAELVQTRGQDGSTNSIGTWDSHFYTTGSEDTPGSNQARSAIERAEAAIANSTDAGGDVEDANASLTNAIEAYQTGEFQLAVNLANEAQTKADDAEQAANSSKQTNQLLMFGGIGVVALLIVVGVVWYVRNRGDDYDKLG